MLNVIQRKIPRRALIGNKILQDRHARDRAFLGAVLEPPRYGGRIGKRRFFRQKNRACLQIRAIIPPVLWTCSRQLVRDSVA